MTLDPLKQCYLLFLCRILRKWLSPCLSRATKTPSRLAVFRRDNAVVVICCGVFLDCAKHWKSVCNTSAILHTDVPV
jgi:hypothetical protein